ncbi:MAG: patatin-like phospholipase family protein [Candidatus Latescibacteria bacterium]|nr:patatin-like phospholipase family protein [Candidatus Latescibacterota bacterium]
MNSDDAHLFQGGYLLSDLKGVKIGLALASGGSRGSAHAGVLKVLERENVSISAVAGSSIGAVVGGAYAAGVSVERIEQEWLNTDLPKVVRSFLPTFPRAGLSSGSEIHKYLQDLLDNVQNVQVEKLPIPFAAIGCDIDTGEAVVLDRGSLADAMRASASIPGIFHPVRWGGHLLVDGGLVEPMPVRVCREMGADIVIGVDIVPIPYPTTSDRRGVWERLGQGLREGVTSKTWIPGSLTELLDDVFKERPEKERPLPGVYSIINQSVAIFQQEIMRLKLTLWPADMIIHPELPRGLTYLSADEGIRAGERAMERALPELHALLAEKG